MGSPRRIHPAALMSRIAISILYTAGKYRRRSLSLRRSTKRYEESDAVLLCAAFYPKLGIDAGTTKHDITGDLPAAGAGC